jgi:hypothetical protein
VRDGAVPVTVAAGAVALLLLVVAVAVVPGVALLPVDELELVQPASATTPMADTAATASLLPFLGRPDRDSPCRYPSLQVAGVP